MDHDDVAWQFAADCEDFVALAVGSKNTVAPLDHIGNLWISTLCHFRLRPY
jgi:hypothetical protein